MDVLWQRQIDLHIILRTLPVDSWTIIDGVFVREKPGPWSCHGSYLNLSPCRGTFRGMSGSGSKNTLRA